MPIAPVIETVVSDAVGEEVANRAGAVPVACVSGEGIGSLALRMPQTAHDHHYVPQGLIRRWSADGTRIHAYRLLVSDERVPPWKLRPIKGVAVQRDLYASGEDGRARDDFERWIGSE